MSWRYTFLIRGSLRDGRQTLTFSPTGRFRMFRAGTYWVSVVSDDARPFPASGAFSLWRPVVEI